MRNVLPQAARLLFRLSCSLMLATPVNAWRACTLCTHKQRLAPTLMYQLGTHGLLGNYTAWPAWDPSLESIT